MENKMTVTYKNFDNRIIDCIKLGLFKDITVELNITKDQMISTPQSGVLMMMRDDIEENTQLQGFLTYENLSNLIAALSMIRNQIKDTMQ